MFLIVLTLCLHTVAAQDLTPYKDANGKYGYKNSSGKVIIPARFDWTGEFAKGMATIRIGRKYGMIDTLGKEVIKTEYDEIYDLDQLVVARAASKWTLFNRATATPLSNQYDVVRLYQHSKHLIGVNLNNKWGMINNAGKEVIALKYDGLEFSEDRILVRINGSLSTDGANKAYLGGQVGFLDTNGKEVIPFKFEDAKPFEEGLAPVRMKGKWGFIDKSGKLVIECRYGNAIPFSEGLAPVQLKKWGYIDKTGKTVIAFQYDTASPFTAGEAYVEIGKKGKYIDKKGKVLREEDIEEEEDY